MPFFAHSPGETPRRERESSPAIPRLTSTRCLREKRASARRRELPNSGAFSSTLTGSPRKVAYPFCALQLSCSLNSFLPSEDPIGNVSYTRRVLVKAPIWKASSKTLNKVDLRLAGTIEDDGVGMSQVDFANKKIGGGVLGWVITKLSIFESQMEREINFSPPYFLQGAVQEEIRFLICPELIVSRLFVEFLASNEAVLIDGVERFSDYEGYADTFAWKGDHVDNTPQDHFLRKETRVVAIDALHFQKPWFVSLSVFLLSFFPSTQLALFKWQQGSILRGGLEKGTEQSLCRILLGNQWIGRQGCLRTLGLWSVWRQPGTESADPADGCLTGQSDPRLLRLQHDRVSWEFHRLSRIP